MNAQTHNEIVALRAELRAEIQEIKETLMAMSVLVDIRKIAVPATTPVPGSAQTGTQDVSKLIARHRRYLPGSPKHRASVARLLTIGIDPEKLP